MALMRGRGGRRGFAAVATLVVFFGMLAVAGFGLAMAVTGGSGSGAGDRGASAPEPAASASSATPSSPTPSMSSLGRSKPVNLDIPAMKLDRRMSKVGMRKDTKSLELPPRPGRAAWYDRSVSPGQVGPAIVVGYIDAGGRPGVFRNLGELKRGHAIYVKRKDGVTAAYQVDAIKSYAPGKLPMKKIYGTGGMSTLRMITCGGTLPGESAQTNVVVYAHLVQLRES